MKRRLIGVLVLTAMMVVPGLVLAGSWGAGQVLSYDRASGALTLHVGAGQNGSTLVRLQHDAQTRHVAAGNPWGFPPGPCRKLAFKWNLAVRGDAPTNRFSTYLALAAKERCTLGFTASDDMGTGSTHATSLVPIP